MKITSLYVYPIKGLRGIQLTTARLGPQGVAHDRRFMLFEARAGAGGPLKKMQLSSHPHCALFVQEFADTADGDPAVAVRYAAPAEPLVPRHPAQATALTVPLEPNIADLEPICVDLHGSPPSAAYRMGDKYDEWFSACFGFGTILVYIGDGRRQVLGSTLLPRPAAAPSRGWFATLSAMVVAWFAALLAMVVGMRPPQRPWITFTDVAPLLVTTEASLGNVSGRLPEGEEMAMYKFRPNIVVDGEEEWAEDFWAELEIAGSHRLVLTANCARCTSINVDYATGRQAAGELGGVLKKLTKDRRVDKGSKWSPIFGRYASLTDEKEAEVRVGDEVEVTGRLGERTVWDWQIP